MVDVQCDICCETFPLEGFLFSPCGHGFCETCTQSLESSRQCPSCRKPRKKGQLHRIFVTAPEDTQAHAQSLANSMNHLRPDSSPSSAKKVPEEIRRIVEKLEVDEDTANNLLKVAKNMEERLVPIFFRMQLEQDEKRALQEKVNAWHPKIMQAESSASEVVRLKKELEKVEHSKQTMASENDRLTKLLEAETKESEKLRRDVIDERRLAKEKDVLVYQLVQEKENADKQVTLVKKKLKVLAHAQSSSNRKASHSNSADDSLIVEPAGFGLSGNLRQ
ncbi:hypothetical protein BT96DRAFT_924754 [Gymnopus androsaceus JB14]|uniref:RING-type domain-containing protein n=1 Tax=Gymnopus androsaceus JB14 TaxID=1447944 RepID=A0A6A4H3N4_9AGAR|nr:hypothetical protein BT96DRAFT_924754 [Gymnopus androsaceus JB14]